MKIATIGTTGILSWNGERVGTVTKLGLKWDESAHPREPDGTFKEKGGTSFAGRGEGRKVDPATLSRDVLSRMNKHLKAKGFEVRGAEDILELLKSRMLDEQGELWHEDWIEAYDKATAGVAKGKATQAAAKDQKAKLKHVRWDRIRQLGFTNDPAKAGYVDPQGRLIDMSGAVDMSPRDRAYATTRALDHREAGGTAGMQELMGGAGYIRWLPESNMLDLMGPPTKEQRATIQKLVRHAGGEITLNLKKGLGEWDKANEYYREHGDQFYHEYATRTSVGKILQDIDNYYGGAKFAGRDITNSLEFKQWFGNSKVVDDQGSPLVVYHGTTRDFTSFNQRSPQDRIAKTNNISANGMFFAKRSDIAEGYADSRFNPEAAKQERRGATPASRLMPVYLSIRNPKVYDTLKDFYDEAGVKGNRLREELESQGYDGVHAKGKWDSDEYVAFTPAQIKSATGNQGTFDPKNADIRFAGRGKDAWHADAIEQAAASKPGQETSFGDLFKSLQAAHPHLTIPEFHQGLLALQKAGKISLAEHTRAPAEVADDPHVLRLPPDRFNQYERLYNYVRPPRTRFAGRGRKPENGMDPIDNLLGGSQGYLYKGGKLQTIQGEHSATVGPIAEAVAGGAVRIRDHGQFVAFQGRSKASVDAAIKAYVRDVGVPKKITAEWPGRYFDDYQGGGGVKYSRRDLLPGGKADGKPVKQFDPQQLLLGTIIELEHTHNVRLAREIAMDHLTENRDYYRLLSRFVEQPTMRPMGGNPLVGFAPPSMFSHSEQPEKYAANEDHPRSPSPHGITIQGKFYRPGEWIPKQALEGATETQRKAIATNDSTQATLDEPDPDTAHLGETPQGLLDRLQAQGMLRHATLVFGHGGVVINVDGRQLVVRVAKPGELEQLARENQQELAMSLRAGGIHNLQSLAGAYRDGTIILAPDFTDGEMNHELIHGLRDLGIISAREVQAFGGEEEMAYAYQRWTQRKLNPHAKRDGIFQRIRDFFKALFGDDVARQRRAMRRFDRGQFTRPIDWGKVLHYASLLGLAAMKIRDHLPEIRARRQSVVDMLQDAVHAGNYQPSGGLIKVGDVNPQDPTTGIRDDGTIITGAVLFATRDWEEWLGRFEHDPDMRRLYTAHDRAELRKGMEATARIFGDFHNLPPEDGDRVEHYTNDAGQQRTRIVRGPSPVRDNADPLFKETFDVTTVCPKQDLFVALSKVVQNTVGRIFGKEGRQLLNRFLSDNSLQAYCSICYGQGSRNNAAQGLKSVAEYAWPAWQKTMATREGQRILKLPNTNAKKKLLMKQIFHNEFGRWNWWNKDKSKPSLLLEAFAKYGDHPEVQEFMKHSPNLHDVFFHQYDGPPLTETQKEFTDLVRKAVQGGLKPNVPKGWASYSDQLLNGPTKDGVSSIERIHLYNKSAGFRMNSQSDFRPWHVLETSQFLTHLGSQGGMAHVYTRVPEFVEIFGETGIKFNLSCGYSHNTDGTVARDPHTNQPVWDMLSFPQHKAMTYRAQYPTTVGTMLVATSLDALMTGLDDKGIDMIIPYHAGSVPKSVDRFEGYTDFSQFQHEHWPATHEKGQIVSKRVTIRGVPTTVHVAWKEPITREHHHDDKERYLAICDAFGITPRFPQLCGRGAKWHGSAKAKEHPLAKVNIDHPHYMKVVRDVAVTSSRQKAVDPRKINWEAAERHAANWMARGGQEADAAIPRGLKEAAVELMTGGAPPTGVPKSFVGVDSLRVTHSGAANPQAHVHKGEHGRDEHVARRIKSSA